MVIDALTDCFKFPKPHVHGLGNFALPNVAKRIAHWPEGTSRVAFIPFNHEGSKLVFLGFRKHNAKELEFDSKLLRRLIEMVAMVFAFRQANRLKETLNATEIYVREVGHDFASNVQAILAKLSLVRKGRVPESALPGKLAEIDAEVRSAYGLADQLGVTVDPNYQIRNFGDFELCGAVQDTTRQLTPDAGERKVTFSIRAQGIFPAWGDINAVRHALVHLCLNAVKYSYGGTDIMISIAWDEDFIKISVANRGHKLPEGLDRKRIWDLGFRGKEAKELHVNGSGVGLFTVKKIIIAHHGSVGCDQVGDHTAFWFRLPRKEYLRKKLGVLL